MTYKTKNVLGYDVFCDSLNNLNWQNQKCIVNTINQYSYCIAKDDKEFDKALKSSDILIPDGIGIVKAAKWLNGDTIRKIAGADIHDFFLEALNRSSGRCFYMGSSNEVLTKIKNRLSKEFPKISVEVYSPPYKTKFDSQDNRAIQVAINEFDPQVIFVGMTAPKQEKWVYNELDSFGDRVVCSIGAVFDFYAGTVNRPSKFWQKLGLEWLGRLIKEPKRMWKRYIFYGVIFAYHLIINFNKK